MSESVFQVRPQTKRMIDVLLTKLLSAVWEIRVCASKEIKEKKQRSEAKHKGLSTILK